MRADLALIGFILTLAGGITLLVLPNFDLHGFSSPCFNYSIVQEKRKLLHQLQT